MAKGRTKGEYVVMEVEDLPKGLYRVISSADGTEDGCKRIKEKGVETGLYRVANFTTPLMGVTVETVRKAKVGPAQDLVQEAADARAPEA